MKIVGAYLQRQPTEKEIKALAQYLKKKKKKVGLSSIELDMYKRLGLQKPGEED